MQIEKILQAAAPVLEGKKIKDAVIGISLIAVELDDGSVGVSYVLREHLKSGCAIFPFGQLIIGKTAPEIAQWAAGGIDDLQRSAGIAVLGAASHSLPLVDEESKEKPFGVAVKDTDTVGIIGYIHPVVKTMSQKAQKVYVFDQGMSEAGDPAGLVAPMEKQAQLLPQCDIVFMSGTTLINGTLGSLLDMCPKAREAVLIGSSTPMYPEAFRDTKVTVLAGAWWDHNCKEEIFKRISLAAGIDSLREFMIKKTVRVR